MKTLQQHIKQKRFSKVYLLYGEEAYLRKGYKDSLQAAIISNDTTMNFSYYEGKNLDVSMIIEKAETLPFFGERRLIIIENSDLFSVQSLLADRLDTFPESTHILFVEKKVDKRSKLYKRIKKIGTITELKELDNKKLKIFVASLLKKDNKRITENTVSYLLEKIGTNMSLIQNEVEKLTCYAYDRDQITKEDIDDVCVEQTEGKIFQMIDAIVVKDKDTALNFYYDLLELKEKPMSILFLLSRHFKILLQVKDLSKFGYDNYTIANKVGVSPYFVGKYIRQSNKFSMDTIMSNLHMCTKTEEDVKTGRQNDQLGIEVLIMQFV